MFQLVFHICDNHQISQPRLKYKTKYKTKFKTNTKYQRILKFRYGRLIFWDQENKGLPVTWASLILCTKLKNE